MVPEDLTPSELSITDNPAISYSITLVNNLLESVQTHDYPNSWLHEDLDKKFHGAVLVDPVFVSHDDEYNMWKEGQPASKGIGQASMFGISSSNLTEEIDEVGPTVKQIVRGLNLVAAPMDADGNNFVDDPSEVVPEALNVDADHQLISSFIRIAPSPCWFTGFHDFAPVSDDGMWLESFTVPAFPYTSNLATGSEYLAPDRELKDPAGDITRFEIDTIPKHSKVFLNKKKTDVPPVAYIKFAIQRETKVEEELRAMSDGDEVNEKNFIQFPTVAVLAVIGVGVISVAVLKIAKRVKYRRISEEEVQTLVV